VNIGGMAEVWRGKMFGAGGFERLVAIKRILPNIAEDDEFISMFIDEAKISVQLAHANIGQIYELGQISNSYFIAMEYIPGKDMRAIFDRCRKKNEPAPVPLVAYVVSKMCEGLDYAHRKKNNQGQDLNIVHRDISPQNILVSFEGEVKVIDFGIAKAAGKATKTQAGILKGKFGYMSPEQIRGLELDRRSDIFAIGVCLYEMLTGERLFVGDSDFSVLEKVRKAEVAPPSTYNKRIPEALEKIVLKALARDVAQRYQYANELGDDLQRFLITSDTIFGRKDLMQYMKATFAEDVEREKQRLQEYADIKAPENMLSALGSSPPVPSAPAVEAAPPPPAVAAPAGLRRANTLSGMPKPAAAAPPAPPPILDAEDSSGATMVINSPGYFTEPATTPMTPGRKVTPVEVPRSPVIDAQPPQRPPSVRMQQPAPATIPARPSLASTPAAESTTVTRGRSATLDGIPRVGAEPTTAAESMGRPSLTAMPAVTARPSMTTIPAATARPSQPVPPVLQEQDERDDGLEDEEDSLPPAAPPPARSRPSAREQQRAPVAVAAPSRLPLILSLLALVVMLVGVVGAFIMLRPVPTGFILVHLSPAVHEDVRVSVSGDELTVPRSGPILQPVKAGPAVVLVSAKGYKSVTLPVTIEPGTTPTSLEVKLEREQQEQEVGRTVLVVVLTQPSDAEVKVDGKVVREKGNGSTYISELPAGTEVLVQASAPGFKPAEKRFTPSEKEKSMEVQLKLEPEGYEVEVLSVPTGATIFAGGKEWGVTPSRVRLPAGVKQMSLKLRCHDEVDVQLTPASGGGTASVRERLKKQRGCR
jgi:serine/threonine protein kinase